jgi:hypothetical protein
MPEAVQLQICVVKEAAKEATVKEKLLFVRLPILLFVLFFIGRLAVGAGMGISKESYDMANRLFSMVVLQVHVGLLWGAVGRRYRGYGIGGSITAVVLAVLVSQILIFAGTAFSYLAGVDTFFNFPQALNQQEAVGFGAAMIARTASLIGNCIFGAIAASIGWALGGLIPKSA